MDSSLKDIFDSTAQSNAWGDPDSVSGPGSNLVQTETIRKEIPALLAKYGIKRMLDAPCGDFFWMKEIKPDLAAVVDKYIGGDIVSDIIKTDNSMYGDAKFEFQVLDVTDSDLPPCDLVFCRDCLVHLPYYHIYKALRTMRRSGAKYLLTTTFTNPDRKNWNIVTGDWRPLNLQKFPFLFPAPEVLIIENCTENGGIYMDKSLGLWKLGELNLLVLKVYVVCQKLVKRIKHLG